MATNLGLISTTSVENLLVLGFEERHKTRVIVEYDGFSKNGIESEKLLATFPSFLPPEYYPQLDTEVIQWMVNWIMNYLSDMKVLPESRIERQKYNDTMEDQARFLYFILPKDMLKNETVLLTICIIGLAHLIDDLIEKSKELGIFGGHRSIELISLMMKSFSEDDFIIYSTSVLDPFTNVVARSMSRLRKIMPNFVQAQEYILDGLKNCLIGMTLCQLDEESEIKYHPTFATTVRHRDASCRLYLEILVANKGIIIPENIRKSFIFEEVLRQIDAIGSTTNDLVSLGKEIYEGETSSPIIRRTLNGMSLQKSFEIGAKKANKHIQVFLSIGRTLRLLYPYEEELDTFLLLCGHVVDIVGHLMITSKRYSAAQITTTTEE